ncbi:DUF2388 domain-containing protein [Pseudomonas protegens]|uniref:DUF2388 domain-containing protein n=1 Tax=Pseudomonas protegens TaxID=380021 RepID=UPI001C6A7871|nr:DUF2388 domain-containing protein [Pseudomonas protegens]QYN01685.1 DUF2388 domain-containing protein [Pseudomonas protegens]
MGLFRISLSAPVLIAACWAGSVQAFDLTTQSLVVTVYATGQVTSAPFDHKLLLAAQDDAAAFVATDGQLRSARLESALEYLRQDPAKLHASDLELAQAILVQ